MDKYICGIHEIVFLVFAVSKTDYYPGTSDKV
jgi:hypothetical protein